MTHILTLTIIREKVQKNQAIKIFRISSMGVLVVLLVVVLAPTAYFYSAAGSLFSNPTYLDLVPIPIEFPAWCLYHPSVEWVAIYDGTEGERFFFPSPVSENKARYNYTYAMLTLSIVIYGYASRVFLLFPGTIFGTILRIPPNQPWVYIETKLKRLQYIRTNTTNSIQKIIVYISHKLLYMLLVLMAVGNHIYGSKLWEVNIIHSHLYPSSLERKLTFSVHVAYLCTIMGDNTSFLHTLPFF